MNVTILPDFYFEDVSYGMYDTASRIAVASEYGCDAYIKAPDKLSLKWHRTKIQSCVCVVRKQVTCFGVVEL